MNIYEILFLIALEFLTEISQFEFFVVDFSMKTFFTDISRISCFSSKVEISGEAYCKC